MRLSHVVPVVLAFLIVPRFLPAQAAPAGFLGLAVAQSVTEGGDGLTTLEGVHNASWSKTLPLTENLQIYTRWQGTGTHTVDVAIVDTANDARVAEASDDLDFGEGSVTFFTQSFTAMKFPDAGTYAIEVALDSQAAARYAFFVNGDEQFPTEPAYVLSVPATSGFVDSRGNASITGIFESFSFTSFPAVGNFAIVTLLFSGLGTYTHYVEISDASGRLMATSRRASFSAGLGGMSVLTDSFEAMRFAGPGTYTATVFLNDSRVMSTPLVIISR